MYLYCHILDLGSRTLIYIWSHIARHIHESSCCTGRCCESLILGSAAERGLHAEHAEPAAAMVCFATSGIDAGCFAT